MKKYWMVWFGLVVFAFTCRAGEKLHEFNLPDGRSLKAEIMSYNGKLKKVELKLANGKRKKVSPSLFVEEDQKFIREWASLDGFRNKAFFKVSCSRDLVEKWKKEITSTVFQAGDRSETEKMNIGEVKFEKFAYKLLFENRNAVPLENIKVEYCIFCKQKGKGQWRDDPDWFDQQKKGSLTIKKLPAKSKKTEITEPVVIGRQEINGEISSANSGALYEKVAVELEGIWVRIHIKTDGGQTAVRSVFLPEALEGKYVWPK